MQSAGLSVSTSSSSVTREALKFFFSPEGNILREFISEEIVNGIDALSRDALRELVVRLGIKSSGIPRLFSKQQRQFLKALAPALSVEDKKVVDALETLVSFLVNGNNENFSISSLLSPQQLSRAESRSQLFELNKSLRENSAVLYNITLYTILYYINQFNNCFIVHIGYTRVRWSDH
jgi:hypothetical protein